MNMDDRFLKDCAEMLNQVRILLQHYMENPALPSTATRPCFRVQVLQGLRFLRAPSVYFKTQLK